MLVTQWSTQVDEVKTKTNCKHTFCNIESRWSSASVYFPGVINLSSMLETYTPIPAHRFGAWIYMTPMSVKKTVVQVHIHMPRQTDRHAYTHTHASQARGWTTSGILQVCNKSKNSPLFPSRCLILVLKGKRLQSFCISGQNAKKQLTLSIHISNVIIVRIRNYKRQTCMSPHRIWSPAKVINVTVCSTTTT